MTRQVADPAFDLLAVRSTSCEPGSFVAAGQYIGLNHNGDHVFATRFGSAPIEEQP